MFVPDVESNVSWSEIRRMLDGEPDEGRPESESRSSGSPVALFSIPELMEEVRSDSTLRKASQAARLLRAKADLTGAPDPAVVTEKSSDLVISVLVRYTGYKTAKEPHEILGRDSLNGMIQGLRIVYERKNHTENWNHSGRGNPLNENPNIKKFRELHKRKVAELGALYRTAAVLSDYYVAMYGKQFFLCMNSFDIRDAALHCMFLIGMNCGLRFDEMNKIKMTQVTCTLAEASFNIAEKTKNSFSIKR